MTDSPSTLIIRRYREPRTRWLPCHQKRAGLGVWAAVKSWQARNAMKRWKRTLPFDPELLIEFSGAVAGLIRAWSPVLPPGTVITAPPQGASVGQPYAAEALGRAVAEALGLPYVEVLARTDCKRHHGPHASLRQAQFVCTLHDPAPPLVVIVDDLCTSGRTMRNAIEAIQYAGVAAFGFCYSGC